MSGIPCTCTEGRPCRESQRLGAAVRVAWENVIASQDSHYTGDVYAARRAHKLAVQRLQEHREQAGET